MTSTQLQLPLGNLSLVPEQRAGLELPVLEQRAEREQLRLALEQRELAQRTAQQLHLVLEQLRRRVLALK